jgi:hypothetical protein
MDATRPVHTANVALFTDASFFIWTFRVLSTGDGRQSHLVFLVQTAQESHQRIGEIRLRDAGR